MYTPFNKTQKRARRHVRTRAKMSGTATRPRLVVFRSLNNMYAQLIDDTKGATICAVHDMKDSESTKTDRAKLIGNKIAEMAKQKGIESCVFDRNGYMYHGRVKALADGAREAGLKF